MSLGTCFVLVYNITSTSTVLGYITYQMEGNKRQRRTVSYVSWYMLVLVYNIN